MTVDLREALYKISINYVKKEPYTGSMDGIRFLLRKGPAPKPEGEPEKEGEQEEDMLLLWIWPEPLCFEKTEESEKKLRVYPFSQEGLDGAVELLMSMQGGEV